MRLSDAEASLALDAIESYEYWELSDPEDRSNGFQCTPAGADDGIDEAAALTNKIETRDGEVVVLSANDVEILIAACRTYIANEPDEDMAPVEALSARLERFKREGAG